VRVRLDLDRIGDQQDRLEEIVDPLPHLGRDRDDHRVALPLIRLQADLGELVLDAVRVGIRAVDLVQRHHDRDAGRLGVGQGLTGLRHHAVIGRHD